MLIRTIGLAHRYEGGATLFHDLDLILGPGGPVAVTGPSGSGKSTLLGILGGFIDASDGCVDRSGVDRVVWVSQHPMGVTRRSALDHVALPLVAAGATRAEAEIEAMPLLGRFGLGEVALQPYRHLSGGQAQRLMLARAVAARPDLLLVDEPTAQLDPTSARSVTDVLHRLSDGGALVLVATHDASVVAGCDRVVRLGLGP